MLKLAGNSCAMTLCASAAVAFNGAALADTLYDSEGFESPTFSTSDLVGQDGWVDFGVLTGGNSTATVSSSVPVAGGSQAVDLARDGSDGAGNTGFYVDVSGAPAHDRYVFVDFDLYVVGSGDQDPGPGESYGPGVGIEIYVPGLPRVAAFGVDSADAAFYQATDNAGGVSFDDVGLLLDAYQSWHVILDFVDEVYTVEVDGVALATATLEGFLEDIDYAGGDRLSDASLVVAPTDLGYLNVVGSAYVDNYKITDASTPVIPEPASLALLATGALAMLRRRR